MGLVGRRDGRNFGYGRQLSYAGPQALRDLFGGGITGRSRHTVIAGRRLYAGAAQTMDQGLTMRDKLIGRPCWTTRGICASKLNKVSSPSPLRKIGCPV